MLGSCWRRLFQRENMCFGSSRILRKIFCTGEEVRRRRRRRRTVELFILTRPVSHSRFRLPLCCLPFCFLSLSLCRSPCCLSPQQIPHPWALFKLPHRILWGGYAAMTLCCHSSINVMISWPWTICFEKLRQYVHTVLEYGHMSSGRIYCVSIG